MKTIIVALLLVPTLCFSKPVLMVGDSIFALSRGVANYLNESGHSVTDKSKVLATISDISSQYTEHDTIPEYVVLDGGGNDILLDHKSDCKLLNERCRSAVDEVIGLGQELLERMRDDGVKEIIYVGIYHFQKFNSGLNPTVDYAMDKFSLICTDMEICTFVDSRDFITVGDLFIDDLHPNSSGSLKIGIAVDQVLRESQDL